MDAREIESLSMLLRGFSELKEANAELTYALILDILQGINEWVFCRMLTPLPDIRFPSNASVKNHVQTSRVLFPHKRIIRKSEMTSKGLVVTEEQEEISGLPSPSTSMLPTSAVTPIPDSPPASPRRSPISELLYLRWLEGLKLKWPSMMST